MQRAGGGRGRVVRAAEHVPAARRLPALRARQQRRVWRLLLWFGATLLGVAGVLGGRDLVGRVEVVRAAAAPVKAIPALGDPDRACIGCHREIAERYWRTTMARGSGRVGDELQVGGFTHAASGVEYKVFRRDGATWMSFHRPAGAGAETGAPGYVLDGERQLEYFVGSGQKGRTYLYEQGGQWYELPINWYARGPRWDMAPAFDAVTRMPRPLPTDAGCLHCHATAVAQPEPTAGNRFAGAPFGQGGVGCSACHGDGAAHVASAGKVALVNPGALPVAQRDSACLNCHLEGDVVVYRSGKTLAAFRAGDDVSDYAVYFVRARAAGGGGRAASQWEALLGSACKRAVGDRMTCTTCHDPHGDAEPGPARVAEFRAKCLSCHTGPTMATAHHPEQPDCASCHMPSRGTTDISHEQTVDHNIEARPAAQARVARVSAGEQMVGVPVGGRIGGDRELGLAYAQIAERGDRAAGEKALPLLRAAEAQESGEDAVLHVNLGYLLQRTGQAEAARAEYIAALRANPYEAEALGNLGVLDATSSRLVEAVRLLDRLVVADPGQTAAGLNLAFIECSVGQVEQARALIGRLLEWAPDAETVRVFARTGEMGGARCGGMAGR